MRDFGGIFALFFHEGPHRIVLPALRVQGRKIRAKYRGSGVPYETLFCCSVPVPELPGTFFSLRRSYTRSVGLPDAPLRLSGEIGQREVTNDR